MSCSNWLRWSLLAVSVFVGGCGNRGQSVGAIPVTGLVLLDNQPAVGVTVSFSPDDPKIGMAAVGTTDSSGRFTLTTKMAGDGAVPGAYAVIVTKTATVSGPVTWKDPRSSGTKLSDEDLKTVMEGMKGAPKSASTTGSDIPARYGSRETSGFAATVTAGETNDFTFAMTK